MSATEISQDLDIPMSSGLDIMKTLAKLGYVTFDSRGRTYFPSLRVAFLCRWIERSLFGDESVVAMLDEIREVTGETVYVSALNDLDVQVIYVRQGKSFIRLALSPGQLLPIFSTSLGIALLSNWSEKDVKSFVARYSRRKKDIRSQRDDIIAAVDEARKRGFAAPPTHNPEDEAGGVSIPISLEQGRTMVVTVGGPAERMAGREAEFAAIMQKAIAKHGH